MGKTFVIPDIHGCYFTLKELCNKIGLQKTDTVIFLGDYIDRGKQYKKVLDFIIQLQNESYNIITLMGNHEEMLIAIQDCEEPITTYTYDVSNIVDKKFNILPEYKPFFQNLKYFHQHNDFVCVHAGINFFAPHPLQQKSFMCSGQTAIEENQIPPFHVIHGHFVKPIEEIMQLIQNRANIIGLDNGCYKKGLSGLGNLLCLELDSFELVVQANID